MIKTLASHKKIFKNIFLNFLGLQVYRILGAQLIHSIKLKKNQNNLQKNGFDIYENFLSKDKFASITKEFNKAYKEFSPIQNNDLAYGTRVESVPIEYLKEKKKKFPNLLKFLESKEIFDLVSDHELISKDRLSKRGTFKVRLEKTFQGKNIKNYKYSSNSDPHKDSYHKITKIIYYITDVNQDSAPFTFFNQTNRLNFKILLQEWIKSFTEPNGAPRFSEKFLKNVSAKKTTLTCKKNTLIIADTGYGIHNRGLIKKNNIRKTIWLEYRNSLPLIP